MMARMMLRILFFLFICFSCTIFVFVSAEKSSSSASSNNECNDSHCGKEVGGGEEEEEEVKCISDVFNGLVCSKGRGETEGVLWDRFSFQWDDIPKASSILFHLLQTQEYKSMNRKEQEEEKIRMLEFLDDERMSANYHEKELQLLRHLMQLSKTTISLPSKLVPRFLNFLTTLSERALKLDCDLALEAFSLLQPFRPEDAIVHWGIGHALTRCKERSVDKRVKGAEHLQIALRLNNELGNAYFDLAEYALTVDQIELAGSYFKRAAWIYPSDFKGEKKDLNTHQFQLDTLPSPFGMGRSIMTDILTANFADRESQLARLNFLLKEGSSLSSTGEPWIPSRYTFLISGENFALSAAKREAAWVMTETFAKYPPLPPLSPSTFLSVPKTKIKLGYLSSDIGKKEDSIYRMMHELSSAHNEEKWEVHCFQTVPILPATTSGTPQTLQTTPGEKGRCSRLHDLSSLSPGEAAKFIRNQEIQVLVDLSGHSRTSAMSILALQPAPIQVSFLGWPGTTGAPFIQYFVGDRTSIPEDLDVEFSEKLILLPHAPVVGAHRRITSSSPSVEVFTREIVGLPDDGFLFCNFGSLSNIDSAAVDYWSRILEGTANSILWLFGGEKEAVGNVKNEFKKRGLEHSGPKARLFFAEFLPKATHLKRMELCELYLDGFLHRSSRSILDAIWSGVPILTLPAFPELQRWTTPSTSFRTRLPSSILSSVFPLEIRNGTIATSVYDFQTRAMAIGKQPWNWKGSYMTVKKEAKRISQRNQGKQQEEVSVLFDVSKFVENLEKGFRMAWERYLTGKTSTNLVV